MALALPSANVVTADGIDAAGVQANFERLAQATASLSASSGVVGLPAGLIFPFGGATAPVGYLLCAGQSLSTTTYAALFAAIAYAYGGSGANFSLPDLRGRTVAGKDNMNGTAASRLTATVLTAANTLGATGGVQTYSLGSVSGAAENAAHSHGGSVTGGSHNHTGVSGVAGTDAANGSYGGYGIYGPGYDVSAHTTGWSVNSTSSAHSHTINSDGSGTAHQNTQPTIVLNYVIKT